MSVLSAYFDKEVNQASPIQEDLVRVVNYDADGNEFVSWEPVDYPAIIVANGNVEDWKLRSLLKAGIDPAFPIHTGNPTRLEGISTVEAAEIYAASLLGEDDSKDKE